MLKSKKTKKSVMKSRSLSRRRSNFFAKIADAANVALKKKKSLKLKLNVSKTFVSLTSQFAKKVTTKLSLVTFASSLMMSSASEAEDFDEEKKKEEKEKKKRNDLATIRRQNERQVQGARGLPRAEELRIHKPCPTTYEVKTTRLEA